MIKLIDLLKEIEEQSKEQEVIDDLLGTLNEGAFDDLLTKAKDYAKKGLLTAGVLAALMAAPQLSSAQKSQVKDIAKTTITTQKGTRVGTDVDGINGLFTSQFQFPVAFLRNLNTGTITNLGFAGNDALKITNTAGISVKQMAEWNNYVKWMESKGYSGDKEMDHVEFSKKVLEEYKKIKPDFWVRDIYDEEGRNPDIKKVQTVIKAYRVYVIAVWKLGHNEAARQGFQRIDIEFDGKKMNPTKPEDVKRVDDNFMLWAK